MIIDTSGWADLAEAHGQTVFAAARQVARDDDSAWDCVQEAFLTALHREKTEVEEPVSWLCGVARNHARNLRRSRRRWWKFLGRLTRRRPLVESVPAADVGDLPRALSRLPASQREAVVLRYLQGMSVKEVAAAQRVSEAAAKARVHRGLARLRRVLGGAAVLLALVRNASAGPARKEALLAAAAAAAPAAFLPPLLLLPVLVVAAGYVALRPDPPPPPVSEPVPELLVASLPTRDPPAPPAAAATQVKENRVVFRDLLDGRPLSDFAVRIGSGVFTSDGEGAIEIAPTMADVEPVAEGWRLGSRIRDPLARGGSIWFCRKITVRGRVTVPADFDLPLTEIEIGWRVRDHGTAATHRLTRSRREVRARPDGSFEIDAWAIRDLYVMASGPRWMAAAADVPLGGDGAPGEVVPAIRHRAIRIYGMLRRRDGAPFRRLFVGAYVTQTMSREEYYESCFPLPGSALTAGIDKERAVVNHHFGGMTGPQGHLDPGQFEFFVGVPGEILIVIHPPGGFAAVEHRITCEPGDEYRIRNPLQWVGEDAAVTLTAGGRPVGPGRATLLDLSLGGPQVQFHIPVGKGGRMPTALLTPGHRYRLGVESSGRPGGYLEWQPVDRLELDEVPRRPPWFEEKRK
jgi:RNA polymerase sigma-70 factor (ECF subfamily)